MKTVKIYIETTITGPAAPKRGGYAAALTFTRRNGDIEDRFLKGEEEGTTYNRSVLLAMIYALQKLKEPCRVVFYTPDHRSKRSDGIMEDIMSSLEMKSESCCTRSTPTEN